MLVINAKQLDRHAILLVPREQSWGETRTITKGNNQQGSGDRILAEDSIV